MKNKLVHRSIIATFVSLYLLVSIISTIHVIDFFELSNPRWLAISLAIGFELGAAASLASLVILDKMNRTLVWCLFGSITLMQMQGNMYYAFVHMHDFNGWSELFGIIEEDLVYQKRILSAVSGATLPLVALGFIKSLMDYIKPEANLPLAESPLAALATPEPPEETIAEKIEVQPATKVQEIPQALELLKDLGEDEEIKGEEETKVQEIPQTLELPEDLGEDEEIKGEAETRVEEKITEMESHPGQAPEGENFDGDEPGNVIQGPYWDVIIDGNGVPTPPEESEPEESLVESSPISPGKILTNVDHAGRVNINPMFL